eukprot:11393590-Heterocapsa_arctica.AAC.1
MSLTVERQPKTRSSADVLYKAIPSTAFLGNEPSIQELSRKLVRKALQMGMPWHVIMNTRQCPQNPFDQRNKGTGPDMAIGIPSNEHVQDNLEAGPQDNEPMEEKGEYCPWAIIDAFTNTMWEWWNYTSKADELRIGSWRTIIQIAIDQAESNKSTKIEIPATVIDRAYAIIDVKNDTYTQENGMI